MGSIIEILNQLHDRYYGDILPQVLDGNDQALELFRYTQIGVKYIPELAERDQPPEELEAANLWDMLGIQTTKLLQDILIEYGVPEKYAWATEVENIGVHYSRRAAYYCSYGCSVRYNCGNGLILNLCCC